METKRIPLLTSAFSAIIILMFYSLLAAPHNQALALQLLPVTTSTNSNITFPIAYNNWNAHVVVEGGSPSTAQIVQAINSSNGVVIWTMNLTSSIGSNTKYISGIDCQNTGQIFHSTTISKGGTEYCVVTATGGSGVDRVFIIDATTPLQPGNTGAGFSYTNGYNFGRCVIGGIPQVGGTVYCLYSDLAGANHVFIDYLALNYTIVNGVPTTPQIGKPFQRTTHFDTGYTSGVAQPNDLQITQIINQITGFATNEVAWTLHGGTQVALFNLGTIAQICFLNTGTEAFGTRFAYDPTGVARWYVTTANSVKIFGDASCALQTTLNLSSYDNLGTSISGISIGTLRKEIYLYDDQGKLVVINQTSPFTGVTNLAIAGTTAPASAGRETLADNDNPSITGAGQTDIGVAVTSSASKYFIQYWNAPGAGVSPSPSASNCAVGGDVFINSQGQCCVNIFDSSGVALITTYCQLTTSQGHIATPNTINALRSGANATTFGNTFFCGFGLVSCSNTNIQTNGVGLIFLLFLMIFSYAALVAIHYQTVKAIGDRQVVVMQALNINPILLVVMLGADIFTAFFLGWLNNTTFYSFMAIIAGLVAFGIFKQWRASGE